MWNVTFDSSPNRKPTYRINDIQYGSHKFVGKIIELLFCYVDAHWRGKNVIQTNALEQLCEWEKCCWNCWTNCGEFFALKSNKFFFFSFEPHENASDLLRIIESDALQCRRWNSINFNVHSRIFKYVNRKGYLQMKFLSFCCNRIKMEWTITRNKIQFAQFMVPHP